MVSHGLGNLHPSFLLRKIHGCYGDHWKTRNRKLNRLWTTAFKWCRSHIYRCFPALREQCHNKNRIIFWPDPYPSLPSRHAAKPTSNVLNMTWQQQRVHQIDAAIALSGQGVPLCNQIVLSTMVRDSVVSRPAKINNQDASRHRVCIRSFSHACMLWSEIVFESVCQCPAIVARPLLETDYCVQLPNKACVPTRHYQSKAEWLGTLRSFLGTKQLSGTRTNRQT